MSQQNREAPQISVIIPASNEAGLIGACLSSVLASDGLAALDILVVSNGSMDATADIARGFCQQAATRGWRLKVLELKEGDKIKALNAGDRASSDGIRIYLDADVVLSPALLGQIVEILHRESPAYCSGKVTIPPAKTWISRAYGRIYGRIPFMTTGVPGCGLFAVNQAGRSRWQEFPDLISDDTFVRLNFAANERIIAPATYAWPLVEGFANLIKVRRRQDAGVAQLAAQHPHLFDNDDKPQFTFGLALKLALTDPIGFAIYSTVALAVRLTPNQNRETWSRGR